MSEEKVLAEADNPKNVIIALITIVTLLMVAGIVIGVDQFFRFAVRDEIADKVLKPQNTLLRNLRADEQKKLTHYQWVDKANGVVRIPVKRAMELTLQEWASRPGGAEAPAPATQPGGTTQPAQGPSSAGGSTLTPAAPKQAAPKGTQGHH